MSVEPVGPQCLQKVTVVVQVSVQVSLPAGDEGTGVTSAVVVAMGLVRVTVVGVAAQ